jgi:HSP20 family protein
MLTFYDGWDRGFDELRRQLGQLFDEVDNGGWTNPSLFGGTQVWPRVNVVDTGAAFVLTADVPGLSEKDVNVSIEQDVLTISGERKLTAPEGYAVHRQERGGFKFTRSFNLPVRVNNESADAAVKEGVLTVTLPKAPESQPKRIEIRGS